MRLLVFSDLHLDASFAWAGADLARRRRQVLRDTLERIVALADTERVDVVACAGDLYEHERWTDDTARFLARKFGEIGPTPVLIAPGNHDHLSAGSLYASVDWPDNVHIFDASELSPWRGVDGFTVWGAAHRLPADTPGFLDRGFEVEGQGIHVALFHGSERSGFPVQGAGKVPHAPFDAAQVGAAGLSHAFVGHYHRPREAPMHSYPGAPAPLAFGEEQGGALIAEVDGSGQLSRSLVAVATSPAYDLELDISGCGDLGELRCSVREALTGLGGIARLRLGGELHPSIDLRPGDLTLLAHELPGLEGLVVDIDKVHVGFDLGSVATEPTVRGQFVRDVLAADDLDEHERRRILLCGLRALAGRDDLEVF